jgi:hypothetical protein
MAANKTYLECVNDVLVRLRESEVETVAQNSYSKLIGKFIQDAQRQVEDAYNWNALTNTLTMQTVPDLFNGVLVGSGIRFRVIDVINDSENYVMRYMPTKAMNELFLVQPIQKGSPRYYNFNGVSPDGDTQVDIYPIPDKQYELRFNIIQAQDPLKFDTDTLLVPPEPVIFLAYAKALAERGEDGGLGSSEAYGLYQVSLADHIAIEGNKYPEEFTWEAY